MGPRGIGEVEVSALAVPQYLERTTREVIWSAWSDEVGMRAAIRIRSK
jgi:hypothetical protein